MSLRRRAIVAIEDWWHADRDRTVRPTHPLVTVQEMQLEEGEGGSVRGSQKRTGRSMPLIRDLPYEVRYMEPIIAHVGEVDIKWRRALEWYAEHGTVRKAAQARKVKPAALWRDFNAGVVVVMSELVRRGL